MADYLNFAKILPPKPNDPVVNEATQLNANWDLLDTKLQPYLIGGTLTLTEIGQEYFDTNFRYAVWDGAAPRLPDDIDAGWSAWTALPMFGTKAPRPSLTPRWRNNSLYRMVELSGGVLFDSSANAWTPNVSYTLSDDVAGSIPASMQPIGGLHVSQAAIALTSGTGVAAGAYIYVDKVPAKTYTTVRAYYMGGNGGGNFIQLDQVWWWY